VVFAIGPLMAHWLSRQAPRKPSTARPEPLPHRGKEVSYES
jgi:hypothetical protein